MERVPTEADTQKWVVLSGFEVAQVVNIVTWMHYYARYTAVMAAAHPTSTPGFMAHMLTVLKAYTEVEDPARRVYDEAFREKMAATGCKTWGGMDVQLYQEVCAGKLRRKAPGREVNLEEPVVGEG